MCSEKSDMCYIKEGDYVIVKTDMILRLVELKKGKPHFLGKRKAHLSAAVGYPYSSFFEIKSDGSLSKVDKLDEIESLIVKVEEDSDSKDNRCLTDTGESQKLTTSDIENFKKQGMSGQEMVKKIVANSSSFQEKTPFAQEKYLRKKQKKYLNFVQLLKPNIRLLAEMYYMQGPLKICNLRIDSLSQMLAYCNIMSGGKYMIMDTVLGLLTAAVVEKLGTSGVAVQLHLGPFSIRQPYSQVIKALNVKSILYNIDVKAAMALLRDEGRVGSTEHAENPDVQSNPKQEKLKHIQMAKEILSPRSMDSLLIAVKNHPANVLQLLDFLSPSRPFAIFSMYQEPLVDCYVKLKSRGDILSLNITETWLRKYQVLPDRTHPCYNMSGNGGFLLTGLKVEPKNS